MIFRMVKSKVGRLVIRAKLATLLTVAMLTLVGCRDAAPAACSTWVGPWYPPDRERDVLIRDAPVTARWIAGHNAAYEAACGSQFTRSTPL